ncbi:HD domain-containing protein [Roseateles oligotrophus]|uniref:HD domain-containing protein n=1 Tax=Roseateles oligotrophus TaxID=1769250 RepID=A0ABT2YB41_9BURK|nr:HD domain-containing protein [Roseateles oligotrophus]MCV2367516.1 HD domain-containing protein [Roseateles oligotrophus]
MDVVHKIEALFERRGATIYTGRRLEPRESVSALEHALQCAQLAEWAYADNTLVAAALLHDLGELIDGPAKASLNREEHELRALTMLASGGFGPEVLEPIRLHVQAKRYLVSTDERYAVGLSAASQHSLGLQGGRMNAEERMLFLAQAQSSRALQLRRWDDLAKQPGKRTPPLAYYLNLLDDVLREARQPARVALV